MKKMLLITTLLIGLVGCTGNYERVNGLNVEARIIYAIESGEDSQGCWKIKCPTCNTFH